MDNFKWTDKLAIEFFGYVEEIKSKQELWSDVDSVKNLVLSFKNKVAFEELKHNYKPLPAFLKIGDSKVEGQGLFSKVNLGEGTFLGVSHIPDARFQNGLIRTPLGGFINHSFTPNVEKRLNTNDIFYYATIKDIKVGEELFVDYSKTSCLNTTCESSLQDQLIKSMREHFNNTNKGKSKLHPILEHILNER